MQVMVRMRRRRRSTIGNHVAYATVFSKPPVAPIQHIHTALGMQQRERVYFAVIGQSDMARANADPGPTVVPSGMMALPSGDARARY